MALPKIKLPKYSVKLLTTDKSIWIRPFTVKEEKILLMAQEGSNQDMAIAILQIIENCILDGDDIKVENMPFFEALYLFMYIKKISTGEDIVVNIKEIENINGEEIEHKYEAFCNLDKDLIVTNKDFVDDDKNNLIKITGNDIFIRIKPLLYKDYIKLLKMNDSEVNSMYNAIVMTIKEIFDKENVYNPEDFSMKELLDFYESIPFNDREKIKQLYEKLPSINFTFHYTDYKGEEKTKIIDNISSDFLA